MSEAPTFGVGYFCNAFWCRETCRDEPFSAKRPFSTGFDVETEHGGVSSVTGCRRSLKPACRVNARPTHENVSALPGCWSRDDLLKNVHEHPEEDFIFFPSLQNHIESHMITNEHFTTQTKKCSVRLSGKAKVVNTFSFCELTGNTI